MVECSLVSLARLLHQSARDRVLSMPDLVSEGVEERGSEDRRQQKSSTNLKQKQVPPKKITRRMRMNLKKNKNKNKNKKPKQERQLTRSVRSKKLTAKKKKRKQKTKKKQNKTINSKHKIEKNDIIKE